MTDFIHPPPVSTFLEQFLCLGPNGNPALGGNELAFEAIRRGDPYSRAWPTTRPLSKIRFWTLIHS